MSSAGWQEGKTPREAARKAMDEVTSPVIAVALVLCAVFVPCAFISGITGQFFRQFAVTIATSTVISAFNSLTLSPALAALILKPHGARRDPLAWLLDVTLGWWFFRLFNQAFSIGTSLYVGVVGQLLRVTAVVLLVYCGLLGLTWFEFQHVPTGFVPEQDKGYLLLNVQLPDSASVERTQEAMRQIENIALGLPGVDHTVGISGQSLLLAANAPNLGSMYVMLKEFSQRRGISADDVAADLRKQAGAQVRDALLSIFGAPPIDGLGTTGGFKIIVEDRGNLGLDTLQQVSDQIVAEGNQHPRPDRSVQQRAGKHPLALSRHRPHQVHGRRPVDANRLRHAANLLGLVLCQQLQRVRPLLAGQRHGRPAVPRPDRRPHAAQNPQQPRRHGPAGHRARRPRHQRPGLGDALQHVFGRGHQRQHGPRNQLGPGDHVDAKHRKEDAAPFDGLRLDRTDLHAIAGRQHGGFCFRPGRGLCLFGAGRPVRKLEAADGRHPGRADVLALFGRRRLLGPARRQHLHADRAGGSRRAGQQERDSDRRIRQAAARKSASIAARP